MADTIRMYSGDAKVFTVTITDEADAAVDCSTATAIVGTCRSAVGGSSTFAISLADGDIAVGGAGKNVLTCTIPPEDTASVTAAQSGTTYYMDIEVTWSAANVQSFPRDANGDPSLLNVIIYGDMTT